MHSQSAMSDEGVVRSQAVTLYNILVLVFVALGSLSYGYSAAVIAITLGERNCCPFTVRMRWSLIPRAQVNHRSSRTCILTRWHEILDDIGVWQGIDPRFLSSICGNSAYIAL